MKSLFVTSLNGANKTYINWTPKLLQKLDDIGRHLNIYNTKEIKQKIKTLHELGLCMHDWEFIGFLGEYRDFLQCLCSNLYVKDTKRFPLIWFPRLYFYLDDTKNVRFLEFHIGTQIVIVGYHDRNKQQDGSLKNNSGINDYLRDVIYHKDSEFERLKLL